MREVSRTTISNEKIREEFEPRNFPRFSLPFCLKYTASCQNCRRRDYITHSGSWAPKHATYCEGISYRLTLTYLRRQTTRKNMALFDLFEPFRLSCYRIRIA